MRTSSRNSHLRRVTLAALFIFCAQLSVHSSEAETIAALEAAGAQFKKDKAGVLSEIFIKNASAITPEQWKRVNTLSTLRKATFYNKCTLNDETLPLLSGLVNLEEFAVDGANLTDKGMQGFAAWKKLRRITFFHVLWGQKNFNGTGLEVFASLPALESFGMGGSTLTNDGLAALAKVTQLKEVNIWHTNITDEGTVHVKALTNLKKLRLAGQCNAKLTEAMVANAVTVPSIERLSFGETRLSYEALKQIKQLPALKELELERIEIPEEDVAKLKADLPNLVIKQTPPTEKDLENMKKAFAKKS
jgi:hypothetical protein